MMMMKFFSLILVAALAVNVLADNSDGTCPDGHKNGEQVDVGRYWYECQNGQMVPKGCLSEDNRRVDIDGTYDTKQYRMQCIKGSDGFLTVVFKACIFKGSEHDVDSQWDDGTAFYTCVKEGNNVRVITLGCVDGGRQLKIDERVAKDEFLYQCRKSTDGTPKTDKIGCIFNGKKYTFGETMDDGKTWFTCTDKGAIGMGCMYNDHKMHYGEQYTKDHIKYTCTGENEGKTAMFTFSQCLAVQDDGAVVEKRPGCYWQERSGTEGYEYRCLPQGKNAAKVQLQCLYYPDSGAYQIKPGCAKVAKDMTLGCVQQPDGTLKLMTYSADQIKSLPDGLRQC